MIWMDEIRRRLDQGEATDLPPEVPGAPAAVLVPLFVKEGALHLLLTRRSDDVESHRGQVAFPGGMAEEHDADRVATALRESAEEIGLDPAKAIVLGRLSEMLTITGFRVTPVVAAIPWPCEFTLQSSEIAEVFDVPLARLLDPARREERRVSWQGIERNVLYYHVDSPAPLWGATARMIEEFLELLRRPVAAS